MQKGPKKAFTLEFRNYSLPSDFPVVALLKDKFDFPQIAVDTTYMHFHNCVEIGYCWEGSGILTVEDREYHYSQCDFVIVPPYASHITRKTPDEAAGQTEYLYCDPKELFRGFPSEFVESLNFFQHNTANFPHVIHATSIPKADLLFQEVLMELRDCCADYQVAVRGLLAAFLVHLLRAAPPQNKAAEGAALSRQLFLLSTAVKYIHIHYMEAIAIKGLADSCFMSLTNFRRQFKVVMGTSPLGYITQVRIRKAQECLYATELSILDISLRIGFETLSSFNRHFLKIVGTTPSRWRKLCRAIPKKGYVYSEFMDKYNAENLMK